MTGESLILPALCGSSPAGIALSVCLPSACVWQGSVVFVRPAPVLMTADHAVVGRLAVDSLVHVMLSVCVCCAALAGKGCCGESVCGATCISVT